MQCHVWALFYLRMLLFPRRLLHFLFFRCSHVLLDLQLLVLLLQSKGNRTERNSCNISCNSINNCRKILQAPAAAKNRHGMPSL